MFIIFGSPRSGTTLLSETLNNHPNIFVPMETDFIIPAAFLIDRIKNEKISKKLLIELIFNSKDSQSITSCLSKDQIASAVNAANYDFCSIIKSLYGMLSSVNNKLVAGDKSPNDLMFLQIFKTVGLFESDIKFIHIVRNIRDVCNSLTKVSWAPKGVENYFPRIWSFSNCHLHQFLKDKENYHMVKYESLILNFRTTMKNICKYLEVTIDVDMLNPEIRGKRLGMLSHHKNLNHEITDVCKNRQHLDDKISRTDKIYYEQAIEGLYTFGYVEE